MWKWNWSNFLYSLPSSCISVQAHSGCDVRSTESDEWDSELDVHDTVGFKVIGVTRDDEYQQALEKANELIHAKNDVKVANLITQLMQRQYHLCI